MSRLLGSLLFIFTVNFAFGQHVQLSTPYVLNRSLVNPSYLGEMDTESWDVFGGIRQKWVTVPGAPTVQLFHAAYKPTDLHSVGLQINRNSYATYNYTSVGVPYSFDVKFGDDAKLRLGLAPRIIQSNIDFSKSITELPNDPAMGNVDKVRTFLDAAAGANFVFLDKYRFGVGMSNFLINASVDGDRLLDYTSYSMATLFADASINLVKIDNRTPVGFDLDGIYYFNGINSGVGEFYLRSGTKEFQFGLGYKTVGDMVCLMKLTQGNFYMVYSAEIGTTYTEFNTFGGHFIAIGLKGK